MQPLYNIKQYGQAQVHMFTHMHNNNNTHTLNTLTDFSLKSKARVLSFRALCSVDTWASVEAVFCFALSTCKIIKLNSKQLHTTLNMILPHCVVQGVYVYMCQLTILLHI